jgi:hypothetical protein
MGSGSLAELEWREIKYQKNESKNIQEGKKTAGSFLDVIGRLGTDQQIRTRSIGSPEKKTVSRGRQDFGSY